MTRYQPVPDRLQITAELYTNEARIGLAEHTETGAKVLLVWDKPLPEGTGAPTTTELDTFAQEWLVKNLLNNPDTPN